VPSGEQNIPPEHGNFMEHWDLMIELDDTLATWRLARLPRTGDHTPIAATRLGDHRKAYLTYEGPLSRDRGEVTRVEEGTCEILGSGENEWRFRLMGIRVSGEFCLSDRGDGWRFARIGR
jgi:hypothetical protein